MIQVFDKVAGETQKGRTVRLRGPWHWAEDYLLMRKGVMTWKDLKNAHTFFENPVAVTKRDPMGRIMQLSYTHNLRTNDGIDWTSKIMASGQQTANNAPGFSQTATASVAITAPTATTAGKVTDTNASITTSTAILNQFFGYTLVMIVSASVAPKMAHIVGNSASAASSVIWYFDQWFSPSDPSTSVTAPGANLSYILVPSSPGYYFGLTSTANSQVAADHLLVGEIVDTNGLARAYAATAGLTHALGTNTYKLTKTFTCTGGSYTNVQQCGMFTGFVFPADAAADLAAVGKGGGVMPFENTFTSVNLNPNDTLQIAWTVTY